MQYEVVLTAKYKGIRQVFLSQRTFRKDHAEGIVKLINHPNMEAEAISVKEGDKRYRKA
ncbi:hypothetical protein KAW50_06550 [candidate division WOR-3 bacterium]|nr:hypothetical protein [candidate division WOR-3 bacterium]